MTRDAIADGDSPGDDPSPVDAGVIVRDATARDAEADAEVDGAVSILPAEVTEIPSLASSAPDDPFAALDAIVGDARFVGLGETVHTVGGFYRAKSRMIQYLVRARGFRVVAFETPWLQAEPLAALLRECRERPATNLPETMAGSLFGIWQSHEIADLFVWLCEWNGAHPDDAVVFFGFDTQEPYERLVLLRYLLAGARFDPIRDPLARLDACYGATAPHAHLSSTPIDAGGHRTCLAALDDVQSWLLSNAAAVAAEIGETRKIVAELCANGLRAFEEQVWSEPGTPGGDPNLTVSVEARDRSMATHVLRLADMLAPGRRAVLWAANTHLAYRQHLVDGPWRGAQTCGTFLASELGADYSAIALIGYEVSMNFPGVHIGHVAREHRDARAIEERVGALPGEHFLVDVRPRGVLLPDDSQVFLGIDLLVPRQQYSGLFFVRNAEAMRGLWF